jgi:hypothetical protein
MKKWIFGEGWWYSYLDLVFKPTTGVPHCCLRIIFSVWCAPRVSGTPEPWEARTRFGLITRFSEDAAQFGLSVPEFCEDMRLRWLCVTESCKEMELTVKGWNLWIIIGYAPQADYMLPECCEERISGWPCVARVLRGCNLYIIYGIDGLWLGVHLGGGYVQI